MGFSSEKISVETPKMNNLLSEYSNKLAADAKMENVKVENVDLNVVVGEQVYSFEPKREVKIPSYINQGGYTVTGYGEDGWVYPSMDTSKVADGTKQKEVHDLWVQQDCHYKNDIATINVNGEDRYLIATSPAYGEVGDMVTVEFANGEKIQCVIADQKSSNDPNFTEYGHSMGDQLNIIEFEVNMGKFNTSGNPTTESWDLEWDSSVPIFKISNYGSIKAIDIIKDYEGHKTEMIEGIKKISDK